MAVYSFSNNIILYDGIQITGWDEGDDAIKIIPNPDRLTKKIGVDGSGVVSLSSDESADIEIRVLQTSPINALFTAQFELFIETKQVVPSEFILNDLSGSNIFTAQEIFVAGFPEMVYGKDAQAFTWKFMVLKAEIALLGAI